MEMLVGGQFNPACSLELGLLGLAAAVEALQFCGRLLGDVLQEVIDLATSVVAHWLVLGVLGKPEQCGEAAHVELRRHIVGGGVHLDDGNVLVLQLLGQLLVDGGQLLAVTAPWGVELDERVLAVVDHQLVKVLGHGHLDGSVVRLGNSLTLDVRLQLVGQQLLNKVLQVLHGELVLQGVFEILFIAGQDHGLVANEIVAVLIQFVLEVILGGDRKVDLANELLGNLEHTVAPVVGSLGVLLIVHAEVSSDQGVLEVLDRVLSAVAHKTMAEKKSYRN